MIEYSACGRLCVLSIAQIMLCPMVWHPMFIRAEGVTQGVCSCDCVRGGSFGIGTQYEISSTVSTADSISF